MHVVANGTTGGPDATATAEDPDILQPRAAVEAPVMETESKDLFGRQKDIDYLDIPSFLRTQAD